MKKNAIVIPVLNEEKNIPILLKKLLQLKDDFFIIFVDDNSTDNSVETIKKFTLKNSSIKLVSRKKREGLHAAIISGIKSALSLNTERVITMDGDLSHSPEDIPRLLCFSKTNDLVIGSRFIRGGKVKKWKTRRKIISAIARFFAKILFKTKIKDSSSGFKCYGKNFLDTVNFEKFVSKGYAFQIETVLFAEKNNLKIKEVPIIFKDRERGVSKVNFKEIIVYLKSLFCLKIKNR